MKLNYIVKSYVFLFSAIFHSYLNGKSFKGRLYFTLFLIVFLESILITSLLIIIFTYSSIIVYSKNISFVIYPVLSVLNYLTFIRENRYSIILDKYKFDDKVIKKYRIYLRLFYIFLSLLFLFSNMVEFSSGYLQIFFKYFWEWY